jgi:hypothetical protein
MRLRLADDFATGSVDRYGLTGHLKRILAPGARLSALLDWPRGTFVIAGWTTGLDRLI